MKNQCLKWVAKAVAVNREELHRLIDQITDPIELETAYRAIGSIIKHDEQSWYWTQGWQTGEVEAELDKEERGISGPFDSAEDLFEHLDREALRDDEN